MKFKIWNEGFDKIIENREVGEEIGRKNEGENISIGYKTNRNYWIVNVIRDC